MPQVESLVEIHTIYIKYNDLQYIKMFIQHYVFCRFFWEKIAVRTALKLAFCPLI